MKVLRALLLTMVPIVTIAALLWWVGNEEPSASDAPAVITTNVEEQEASFSDQIDPSAGHKRPPQIKSSVTTSDDATPSLDPAAADDVAVLLTGRVTRAADGTPLEGVRVSLSTDDGAPLETFTDRDGEYHLVTHATSESQTLVFHPREDKDVEYRHSFPAGSLATSSERRTVDLAIDTGWTLTVRVIDPLGLAPRTAHMALVDEHGGVIAEDREVDDGEWVVRDLPVATRPQQQWSVVTRVVDTLVSHAAIAPMPFLAETREVTVLLERAGRIDVGVRVSDGRPAASAALVIEGIDPPITATTDENGLARLDHVPPGVHVVTGSWLDPSTLRTRRFHSSTLIVKAEQGTSWSHLIDAGVTLSGRVVAVGGTPRPALSVDVRSQISTSLEPLDGRIETDAQGRFTIHDIDAGPKLVRVFDGALQVAERALDIPPSGLRDVVIAFGGHVWHDVTTVDTRGAVLPLADITLLATEHGAHPNLAQSWQGVTAGLPRDDPDGPDLGGPRVVSGFQYVGTQAFRQTRLEYPRPLEAPPPGLTGPHVRTIEPPVDISLRAFFEPTLVPHTQTDARGVVTLDIDADRTVVRIGDQHLASVPFAALASTSDILVGEVLAAWLVRELDLWVVASSAGRITEATRIRPGTSTSAPVTLAPSPLLVARVTDSNGSRLHDVHVDGDDLALGTRVTLDTEPLGPAAFVIITDRPGDGRSLDLTIRAPDHEQATIRWTPGDSAEVDIVDVQLEPIPRR